MDRRTLWGLLALALILGIAFPYLERLSNANERPRLLQGMALIDGGTLAIDGPETRGIKPGIDVARAPGGRLYPNKPPGASIPAAVAYAGLRATSSEPVSLSTYTLVARLLGGLLPTLVLCVLAVRRYAPRYGSSVALGSVVAFALATPVAAYAHLLFGHTLAACLLFVGTTLLLDAVPDRPWRAALGGAVAGSAVAVEYGTVFAGIPIAVFVLARARDPSARASVVAAVLGAAAPVTLLALYHDAAFGGPFETGYHHVVRPQFEQIHARGLLGLGLPTAKSVYEHLLSPWGGLLPWAPLVGVALWALVAAERNGEATTESRLSLAILATMLVIMLGLKQTGGWRVGPRYYVAALPFAIPGLALALRGLADRPRAYGVVVGLALGPALANALAANLFPHLIPVGNPLADVLWPLAAAGREPHSVLTALGIRGITLWLVLGGTLALLGWTVHPPRHRGPIWTVAALVGVAFFSGLFAAPRDPKAAQNLAAIEGIWEP